MKRRSAIALLAALLTHTAWAGAWPQPPDHGFAINQIGYAARDGGDADRLVFNGYGEAGLGGGVTAIFAFDGDLDRGATEYVWRGALGARLSFAFDAAPDWLFAVEGALRYQDHAGGVIDPVFAGDGWGGSLRLDAGRAFEVFDRHAFANAAVSYTYRGDAPGETRLELVCGLELSPSWQAGLGFASTFAPGAFYEPGAYERHEADGWLRWRLDGDYAVAFSVTRTLASERAAPDTVFRLGLWTFFAPDSGG